MKKAVLALPAIRRWSTHVLLAVLAAYYAVGARIRRKRAVVVYYGWPDFARKAHALADLLREAGLPVQLRSGLGFLSRARIKFSPNLHIGFWNQFYVGYLPRKYIFYNAEPLSLPRWRDNSDWTQAMAGAAQVWGYANTQEKYVKPLGVPYHYVPFGYAPYYESTYQEHTAGKELTEDIDVLFVGFVSERRQRLLDRLYAAGIQVHLVTYQNPLRGAALDEVIARSRIVLSIFAVDDPEAQVVDLARIDHLLSNGRFVLHERPSEAGRDPEFEQHVATCRYDDLTQCCLHYLSHPEERRKKAAAAQHWFKGNRSLKAMVPLSEIRQLMS